MPKIVNGRVSESFHLHIFQTCRTIYREASTRCFQNNAFEVIRDLHLHDPVGNFIAHVGARWLENLGEQAHSQRKLVIDIDALCPADCWGSGLQGSFEMLPGEQGWVEVLPLLQLIWTRRLDLEVEFVQLRGEAHRELSRRYVYEHTQHND